MREYSSLHTVARGPTESVLAPARRHALEFLLAKLAAANRGAHGPGVARSLAAHARLTRFEAATRTRTRVRKRLVRAALERLAVLDRRHAPLRPLEIGPSEDARHPSPCVTTVSTLLVSRIHE
jgi:hypothetical protein